MVSTVLVTAAGINSTPVKNRTMETRVEMKAGVISSLASIFVSFPAMKIDVYKRQANR